MQNKANFRRAESTLTAVRQKGYDERTRTMPLRKQSQFMLLGLQCARQGICRDARFCVSTASPRAGSGTQNKANLQKADMKTNCRHTKGLGERRTDYGSAKTKPISEGRDQRQVLCRERRVVSPQSVARLSDHSTGVTRSALCGYHVLGFDSIGVRWQ